MRGLKYTKETFIETVNEIHDNKYDYTLTNYSSLNDELEIVCPFHGSFKLIARNHLAGTGCPKCNDISARIKVETKHLGKQKFEEKYTKEYCKELCSRCRNRHDFSREYSTCYGFMKRIHEDWLDEFLPTKKHKLNYENCYNRAKKFRTIRDFCEKDHSAYQKSLNENWIKDFTWLSYSQVKAGYWTYENCYKEALQYKTLLDFRTKSMGAYIKSCQNGWQKEYTWLERPEISTKNEYVVYLYEDDETNSVYVGLTKNLKRRHKEHHDGRKHHGVFEYDNVYKYFNSIGKEVPEPVVLQNDIYAKDAQKYEQYYIDYFSEEGFNLINKVKGGSLGGGGKHWNKEYCYNEALKYKTTTEFRKQSKNIYYASKRNGWFDDYTWLEEDHKQNRWTYEICYDEAIKYEYLSDFSKNASRAYSAAIRNGWLEKFTWLKYSSRNKKGYWTYERCKEESLKYDNKSDFRLKSYNAYEAAIRNGWLYKLFPNQKKYNYEDCYKEAKKYETKKEFRKNNLKLYQAAVRYKWIDILFPKKKKWSYKMCLKEASYYTNKKDFRIQSPKAYAAAIKNGWMKKLFPKNKETQLTLIFD